MKYIMFALVMTIIHPINAQTKTETISKTIIGNMTCTYKKDINMDNGGNSYTYITLFFKNFSLSDMINGSIHFITNKPEDILVVNKLVDDLRVAFREMNVRVDMIWKRKKYEMRLYEFRDNLEFSEAKNEYTFSTQSYTYLSRTDVEELINWLVSIGF